MCNTLSPSEDEVISDFASELMKLTQSLADELYNIDNFKDSENAKFEEWVEAAEDFLKSGNAPEFIYARYGYAVEEYVNLQVLSKKILPPRGYRIRLQVTHGNTRPDIVILNQDSVEIAWMDITSVKSRKHVLRKAGNWSTARSFVAELLYDDLDLSQITTSGSIASNRAPRIMRAARLMNNRLMRHLVECMERALSCAKTDREIRPRDFPRLAICIESSFEVRLEPNSKHSVIQSMLRMYTELPLIKYLDEAAKWLRVYVREGKHQDKAKALSYITDSFNKYDKYAEIFKENDDDDDYDFDIREYYDAADDSGEDSFDSEEFFGGDFHWID